MDGALFAAAMASVRMARGHGTQASAARQAGISPSVLNRYESGKKFPSVPALIDYLDNLGATLHDLADALGQPCRHHLVGGPTKLPPPLTAQEIEGEGPPLNLWPPDPDPGHELSPEDFENAPPPATEQELLEGFAEWLAGEYLRQRGKPRPKK